MLGRPAACGTSSVGILGGRAALAVVRRPSNSNTLGFGSAMRSNLAGSVRSRSYVPSVTRLRPLSESECYTRLYGDRESTVSVIRESEPDRPSGGLLGEQLRQALRRARMETGPTTSRRSKRRRRRGRSRGVKSAVPDVLAPGSGRRLLRDQPGARVRGRGGALREPAQRLLAAAARRGLHAAARRRRPSSSRCCATGIGITNAAPRTTPGSGDLRGGDFAGAAERLERHRASSSARGRSRSSARRRTAARSASGRSTACRSGAWARRGSFVLPSTSPANAAVPYAERLRWFRALRDCWSQPLVDRPAVRAPRRSTSGIGSLLLHCERDASAPAVWATPGGAIEPRRVARADALRRELHEEVGLDALEARPVALELRVRPPEPARHRSWTAARAPSTSSASAPRTWTVAGPGRTRRSATIAGGPIAELESSRASMLPRAGSRKLVRGAARATARRRSRSDVGASRASGS